MLSEKSKILLTYNAPKASEFYLALKNITTDFFTTKVDGKVTITWSSITTNSSPSYRKPIKRDIITHTSQVFCYTIWKIVSIMFFFKQFSPAPIFSQRALFFFQFRSKGKFWDALGRAITRSNNFPPHFPPHIYGTS